MHYIWITGSISKKHNPLYLDYTKYFQKNSTIFGLHEVFNKLSTIFVLHEVFPKNTYSTWHYTVVKYMYRYTT